MTTREGEGHAPAAPGRPGPEVPATAPASPPGSDRAGRPPILVVDDGPAVLALAVRSLRARGYDVRGAASGREALLAIYGGGPTPAVLLADVDMPGMSGIELAARVAADRPGVAIVLMSASPTVLDMARERPELVRGVVAKPFSGEDVVAIVDGLVAERVRDADQTLGDEPDPGLRPEAR
jgi:CheY-like chemotaxis protein